jgi:hypothetical protein
MPIICFASCSTSWMDLAILTPPPLPRPPGMDLCLHNGNLPAEPLGGIDGFSLM